MKKRLNILFAMFFLILFIVPLISAGPFSYGNAEYHITRVIDSALEVLSPFFERLIGDYSTSEFFFSKVLLLILLIIISKNILELTPIGENNKRVSLIISLIVSILSIRFINENNFFAAILIQYGVLGIAITTILPLIIFFYFIHNAKIGTYGRKLFWALYAITLTAIWIFKSSEIPEAANWIYGLTLAAAILFIFIDKTVHAYFGLSHLHLFMKKSNKEGIYRAKERILKLNERRANGIINEREYRQGIKEEEDLIKEFSKE